MRRTSERALLNDGPFPGAADIWLPLAVAGAGAGPQASGPGQASRLRCAQRSLPHCFQARFRIGLAGPNTGIHSFQELLHVWVKLGGFFYIMEALGGLAARMGASDWFDNKWLTSRDRLLMAFLEITCRQTRSFVHWATATRASSHHERGERSDPGMVPYRRTWLGLQVDID